MAVTSGSEPNLAVVYVQVGNYLGRGIEYANRLRAGLARHLRVPHRVYCVTDDVAENYPRTRCKPATPGLTGWWQKLALFKPGQFREERILFLDLDTIILGSLDFLADYNGRFATLRDFYRPRGLGPAVMLWKNGAMDYLWADFEQKGKPQTHPQGDQWWIEKHEAGADILQDFYPGAFVSYKADCANGVPTDARVLCFHGKPRPHEVNWLESPNG